MIDKSKNSTYSWLVYCPSSDLSFASAVKRASLEELQTALEYLETKKETKTACKKIRSQINRLRSKADE